MAQAAKAIGMDAGQNVMQSGLELLLEVAVTLVCETDEPVVEVVDIAVVFMLMLLGGPALQKLIVLSQMSSKSSPE